MFDIGWTELFFLGVIALIVVGPKELPTVLRTVGQWAGKIRRMAGEFQGQFNEAMREAEMADLKKHVDDINDAARSIGRFDPLADDPGSTSSRAGSSGGSGASTASAPPAETAAALAPPPEQSALPDASSAVAAEPASPEQHEPAAPGEPAQPSPSEPSSAETLQAEPSPPRSSPAAPLASEPVPPEPALPSASEAETGNRPA